MQYRIEPDGWGDLTLWRYDSPEDLEPAAIATKHAIQDNDEQWMLMVRGAGLDPATMLLDRGEYDVLLDAAHNFWSGES